MAFTDIFIKRPVLQNREHAYANGPGWSFLIGPFFHGGLMLLDFDEHHRHRRIMHPSH